MKKRTRTWKLLSIMLVLCLSLAGMVFAEEETTEPETVVAAPLQLKTLGQETEDAYLIKITNNTGKDIEYFAVDFYDPNPLAYNLVYQMQEALIKGGFLEGVADGSAGPMTQEAIAAFREANGLSAEGGADEEMLAKLLGTGYDGNVLENGDVFASGETRILFVPRTKPVEEKAPAAEEGKEEETVAEEAAPEEGADALAELLKNFSLTPEYIVSFRGQNESTNYYLYAFPAAQMQTAQLNIDGTIPYVMYTTTAGPEPVSTLDAEKAASKVVYGSTEMPGANDYSYDTGYDAGYDMGYDAGYDYSYDAGYDYGYDDSGYVEPSYDTAPYIVTEEDYPSCDDGSHGVIYRVWSDGTEERIEY